MRVRVNSRSSKGDRETPASLSPCVDPTRFTRRLYDRDHDWLRQLDGRELRRRSLPSRPSSARALGCLLAMVRSGGGQLDLLHHAAPRDHQRLGEIDSGTVPFRSKAPSHIFPKPGGNRQGREAEMVSRGDRSLDRRQKTRGFSPHPRAFFQSRSSPT
jgi:hypothetical protein